MPNKYEIPKYAKTCVLTEPGRFEIRDDVEVKRANMKFWQNQGSGICGSDPEIIRGPGRNILPAYPLSQDMSGQEVVTVGEE